MIAGVVLVASMLPYLGGLQPAQPPRHIGALGIMAMMIVPIVFLILATILSFVGNIGEIMFFHELGGALASEKFKQVALLLIACLVGSMFVSITPLLTFIMPLSIAVVGLEAIARYFSMEEAARLLSSATLQQAPQGRV